MKMPESIDWKRGSGPWWLVLGLGLLPACGGTEVVSFDLGLLVPDDLPMARSRDLTMPPPADLVAPPGYPAGPYGNEVGDVLPNFTFRGYWAPTQTTGLASTQPLEMISFDRVRTSGAKLALIELAAFW